MSVRVLFHNHPGRTPDAASLEFWLAQEKDHDVMAASEAVHLVTRRVGPKGTVADYLEAEGWGVFPGIGSQEAGGATPVFWRRSRFHLWGASPQCHYLDTRVGSWGAGPPVMAAAWTQVVTLKDRRVEDRFWRPMVGHWAPSVTQPRSAVEKQGADALASWEARRRLHRAETEGTARLMDLSARTSPAVPVFVLGDYNAQPQDALLDPLHNVAEDHFPGATHGRRAIDGLFVHRKSPVQVSRARVVPGPLRDDHDAVSYVLRYGRG